VRVHLKRGGGRLMALRRVTIPGSLSDSLQQDEDDDNTHR